MTESPSCVSAESFESRYRATPDPWNYKSSPYEHAKYQTTLGALSRQRYSSAFEPGCSIGELSARLALRCDCLLACDFSPTAVEYARVRCRPYPNVRVECQDLRSEQPAADFDLIVLSEIGYYFDAQTLTSLIATLAHSVRSGGEIVAVHWRGHSRDHVLHADEVHHFLHSTLPFEHRQSQLHPGFRLDTWVK